MKLNRISFLPLLVLAMLANILSQATHETGHRLVYQVMGREPVWAFTKLVQVWEEPPARPEAWVETTGAEGEPGWLKLHSAVESGAERTVTAAAGPIAGLLGAVLGLVVALRAREAAWKQAGLAYSLACSITAVLYYLRSPFRTGGDEYEVALELGVPRAVVEIFLALAFSLCLVLAMRMLPGWRSRIAWSGTLMLGFVATGALMFALDPWVISRVSAADPWFRSVLGYSLPVFLVNALALPGIFAWYRWQHSFLKEQNPAEI